ncbi:MAG: cation-translocating P-type ATPase, partial [Paraclostridium sp.]
GTITENRMTVAEACVNNDELFMLNAIVNSTADIDADENGLPKYLGSATECALLLHHDHIDYRATRAKHTILAQEQFSSATKMMSTTIDINGVATKFIKGAPEVVIELCDMPEEEKYRVLAAIESLQEQSMRCLGFATVEVGEYPATFEDKAKWTGFVGIKDPLRQGVTTSVKNLKKAGVATKMLTGDNIVTATAIGNELGLLANGMRAVESSYIDTLTDDELRKEIETIAIVARSKPDTKMRVVQALQANGEVVAVTGDGINDAPALSKADVGVAMGIAGTEVSKGAADIILTDDSFSTIEKAVKWGRGIYENFQRFVQFQLTVNRVAFLVAIVCTVTGKEMPFTTIQLLWVNIIMDGPPALALGLEPVRNAVLNRKPVDRNASIITKSMYTTIVANALFITSIILLQQNFNFLNVSSNQMSTVLFALFAFSALFNALNSREFGLDSIIPNFLTNKLVLKVLAITGIAQILFTNIFQDFFNSVALDALTWVKVLLTAASIVVVNELVKFVARKIKK